jgi:biotin transport system ATP-binding protein
MPVIDVREATHAYGQGRMRRTVLRDVTVRMDEHRIGIIGSNGSGKSTFARMLNGLVVPSQGEVSIDGLSTDREARAVRKLVGFCFTDPDAQIVMPTVREDIGFTLKPLKHDKAVVNERVDSIMRRFGLEGHADHPAHLLSGGQKQLLALASVLISDPQLLVMDEPTTLLDLRNARMISDVVASLEHQVVLVTHHLDLLDGFDRVLVFDETRLVCDASPAEAVRFYRELMA